MDNPGIYSLGDFSIGADGVLAGVPVAGLDGMRECTISARLAYGSGGATLQAVVSTSLDQGTTWVDIACFEFTTVGEQQLLNLTKETPVTTALVAVPLAAAGCNNGILGDQLTCRVTSAGSYAGSTVLSLRVCVA